MKVTPKAYEDLNSIYGYIVNEFYNEEAADDLLEKIEVNIMRLRDFPFSCSFVNDEMIKDKGYRKLIVDNFIVFHLVNETDKVVVVMRVLHGKQRYEGFI
ncbi:type II toxin-antitoxin system RelE/ParE family toxin [Virgibacillus sp. C22-A2]|uniref:Type II toxin-antitoxin system RelE/ParE family toxin n=1 Tax=Virgibacillus tibetensis TaxID=3042313 RepID=A0ABU6KDK1_9BACI|nr:type II toxin-antitoxin system RelE/ParE family toxin [Virgibacillus sp. C22-A2]